MMESIVLRIKVASALSGKPARYANGQVIGYIPAKGDKSNSVYEYGNVPEFDTDYSTLELMPDGYQVTYQRTVDGRWWANVKNLNTTAEMQVVMNDLPAAIWNAWLAVEGGA